MNVVGHIMVKDLRRLKWIIVLWVLILGAGLGFATIQANLDADTFMPSFLSLDVDGRVLRIDRYARH